MKSYQNTVHAWRVYDADFTEYVFNPWLSLLTGPLFRVDTPLFLSWYADTDFVAIAGHWNVLMDWLIPAGLLGALDLLQDGVILMARQVHIHLI